MRRYLLLVFSLLGLIFCAKQVEATSPVNMKVEVGWNNEFKRRGFIPVKVQISSKTFIKGQLRLSKESEYSRDSELPAKQVEVPAGTTKEFQFLVTDAAVGLDSRWMIVLEDKEKVLAIESVVYKERLDDLMIGIISDQSDTLLETEKWIKGIQSSESIRIYPLKVSEIPTVGRVLLNFDVLIISNLTKESLSQSQIVAIQNWVANGGKLLVNGGRNWKRTSKGLERILPVQFLGKTVEISLPDSMRNYEDLPKESVTVVDSRLKEESVSLHSQQDQVVIAKKNFFQGQVYFVAYDILLAPMNRWEGNKLLWNDMNLFTKNVYAKKDHFSYKFNYDQLKVNQFPEQPTPSLFMLFVVFIVHLLLVGPLLFSYLHLKGKKEWAWLWIPICSCLVALGILVYGQWKRGDQVTIYQTGVIQTNSTGVARVRGISTLFSLDNDDYSVRFPKTFVWPDPHSVDRLQYLIDHQEDTNLVYQQMPKWRSNSVLIESFRSIGGNLQADLYIQDNRAIGEITNSTKYTIKDVWLLLDYQDKKIDIKVGDLKPNERRKVSANVTSSKESFVKESLKGRKYSLYRFAKKIGHSCIHTKACLIGWIDQPVIRSEVANYKFRNIEFYMVKGDVKVTKNSKGDWKIPFGWLKADLIGSDESVGYDFLYHQYYGSADFSYLLGERPKEIQTFRVSLDKTSDFIQYEIYNWRTKLWDTRIGSKALDYFDENGQVLLRVKTIAASDSKFSPPELLIEGR